MHVLQEKKNKKKNLASMHFALDDLIWFGDLCGNTCTGTMFHLKETNDSVLFL